MGTLVGKNINQTFRSLLRLPNDANGLTGTLQTVEDGEGTASPLRLSSSAVDITSNLTISGTVNARDIAVDGSKLDTIEAGADITDTDNVDSVITKRINFTFTDPTADLSVGDNKAYIIVDDELAGMDIISVSADVDAAPVGSTVTIQFHNVTSGQDILSTELTIDATETSSSTAATPAVIDTAQDDLTLGDKIRMDIDAVGSSTAAKGLFVTLRCRTP